MANYDDLDLDLKRKEELVEEAKKLAESEIPVSANALANLRKKWKRFEDYESAGEAELKEKFEGYLEAINSKRADLAKSAVEVKEALVAEAEKLAQSTTFKDATVKMNELMNSWKASVSAGKEADDQLWEKFNAARKTFFENRKQYYANLTEKFNTSKETKEQLIEKAKGIAENASSSWKKAQDAMNAIMDEWKAAGSSGREHDDNLWKQFSEVRSKFNKAKNEYYAGLRATYDERAAKKEDLIVRAKRCVASCDYSNEKVAEVKALRDEWKAVGGCDRAREEDLWNQFNEAVNNYFKNLREEKNY